MSSDPDRARGSVRAFLALGVVLSALAACGQEPGGDRVARVAEPTFSRDVAPILYRSCASCHRPDGVAPFSVLDYEEVAPRAAIIARLTAERVMPPWPPVPGYTTFLNDPALEPEEIAIFERWAAAGAPEGSRRHMPARPDLSDRWRIGEPDLVVAIPEPFHLDADTKDIFRNFVVPVPLERPRYVRAAEFRPVVEPAPGANGHSHGDTARRGHAAHGRMPVHHAMFMVDRTRGSRRLDALDTKPGFDGMLGSGGAQMPDGFFLGWTPGKQPTPFPAGLTWRLDPGSDLVVQLHLQPAEQPVRVGAEIALYFADESPESRPITLRLGVVDIDIPPGEAAYTVEDAYELPVAIDALGVYPHAHLLGRSVHGWAVLPDGTKRWLVRIDDWNFDWQDAYYLAEPVPLPAGSVLRMRITYDNSAANPRNPHDPPRRVVYGPESTDEMGELWVQAVARDPADRRMLASDFAEKRARMLLDRARFAVGVRPDDPQAHYDLGAALHAKGSWADAAASYRRALELRDDMAPAHVQLGSALMDLGRVEEAFLHFRRAVELDPRDTHAHYLLGKAMESSGRPDGAMHHLETAVELWPSFVAARVDLANLLASSDRIDEAESHLRAAVDLEPDFAFAHKSLANVLMARGWLDEAIHHYRTSLRHSPEQLMARYGLGVALESTGRSAEAMEQYATVVAYDSTFAPAHYRLGAGFYGSGDAGRAVAHLGAAVRHAPRFPGALLTLAWILATDADPQMRYPDEALRLVESAAAVIGETNVQVLTTMAAALAAAGRFDEAVQRATDALNRAIAAGDTATARALAEQLARYRNNRPLHSEA